MFHRYNSPSRNQPSCGNNALFLAKDATAELRNATIFIARSTQFVNCFLGSCHDSLMMPHLLGWCKTPRGTDFALDFFPFVRGIDQISRIFKQPAHMGGKRI
jgi:hypothetical protein